MSSPTKYPEIWAALAASFGDRVKTRQGAKNRDGSPGKRLSYITSRLAMNRLDDVLGPENWSDVYTETRDGLMCSITVTLPGGERVTKTDGGGFADMAAEDDVEKSAYSDAFKRACVKLGVARYLYQDGTPDFGHGNGNGNGHGHAPATDPAPQTSPRGDSRDARPPTSGNGQTFRPPTTGRGLFAWTKDMEQRHEVGLLKYINNWSKLQDFPGRMVDWDQEQVGLALAEMERKLASLPPPAAARGEAYEDDLP